MSNLQKLINKLNQITGVSFVRIKNYTNSKGEVSDITINVGSGLSYNRLKQKDYEMLSNMDVNELKTGFPKELLNEAHNALISSLLKPSKTRSKAQKDTYEYIGNNIKVHKETGEIYVTGMRISKTVKVVGDYGEDTRRPLTKAKDFFRKDLKHTKYRQYKIGNFTDFSISGDTLTFSK